jgi:Skp family chaperone for outer membrane proteins
MAKVTDGYTALQTKSKQLQAWHDQKAAYLQKLEDFTLLSNDNFAEVVKLLNQATLAPADTKRLQDLSDAAGAKETRMRALQGKAPRTAAEDEEFNSLQDQYNTGQTRQKAEEDQLTADYEKQLKTARDGFMADVQRVAGALAKQLGYDLVLDAGVILVGGDDLTQQVLDKLNGK